MPSRAPLGVPAAVQPDVRHAARAEHRRGDRRPPAGLAVHHQRAPAGQLGHPGLEARRAGCSPRPAGVRPTIRPPCARRARQRPCCGVPRRARRDRCPRSSAGAPARTRQLVDHLGPGHAHHAIEPDAGEPAHQVVRGVAGPVVHDQDRGRGRTGSSHPAHVVNARPAGMLMVPGTLWATYSRAGRVSTTIAPAASALATPARVDPRRAQ